MEAVANAVVVEADAFKETDVIYRALSSRGHHNDMLQTAELVTINTSTYANAWLIVYILPTTIIKFFEIYITGTSKFNRCSIISASHSS